jgi:hypothetical protein
MHTTQVEGGRRGRSDGVPVCRIQEWPTRGDGPNLIRQSGILAMVTLSQRFFILSYCVSHCVGSS